jgi:CheY-like chemotaxis protein
MTSGSAASHARPRRELPLSLFQLVRRTGHQAALAPQAWRSPPGRSPTPVAAMSPPRTRVLVVARRAVIALDLQRALREAGYRIVGPACSPDEARRLLTRFAIDCAVVDLDSFDAPASAAVDLLEQRNIPFVILTSRLDPPPAHAGRPRLHKPFERDQVTDAIERAIARQRDDDGIQYPVAPPNVTWPRIMPQL